MDQDALITLRRMTSEDVPAAWQLSNTLHWPHRIEDWSLLLRLSEGCVLEDAGEIVGTALLCKQGEFASIGLVIVADGYKGRGLGRRLMQYCIDAAGASTVLLNATSAGAILYRRMGFETYEALHQYQTAALIPPPVPETAHARSVRRVQSSDLPALCALANSETGMARGKIVAELFAHGTESWAIEGDQGLEAFAITRKFGRGYAIGPVVAQSRDDAWSLIAQAMQPLSGQFVRIDCLASANLEEHLTSAGLKRVDQVEQMALGTIPSRDGPTQHFAIANQALC